MGGHFWDPPLFKGPKGWSPPKKIIFGYFVSIYITFRGIPKAAKVLGVLKTPPLTYRVKILHL